MKLGLPDQLRVTYMSENRLVTDRLGNEVFIGLGRDESERLARYWQLSAIPDRQDRQDKYALEERHNRGRVWWQRALQAPDDASTTAMTAEAAFEVGRVAWNGQRALSDLAEHMQDFDRMIAGVPSPFRLAAIHGWLNAFDDEADRICAASRN